MKVSDVVEVSVAPKKKGVREYLEGKLEAAEGMVASLWQRMSGTMSLESRDPRI